MGINTKFYTPENLTIAEAKHIVEKALDTTAELHSVQKDGWGYIQFVFNGEARSIFFYPHSTDFDREKQHALFDLSAYGDSVKIMKLIAPYLGGWLEDNDCSGDDPYYIEKSVNGEIKLTNEQKLYEALAKAVGHKDTGKFLDFIKKNPELLVELNFGN